jgi:cephalosporin-C deacetylase-like acetyl esterase
LFRFAPLFLLILALMLPQHAGARTVTISPADDKLSIVTPTYTVVIATSGPTAGDLESLDVAGAKSLGIRFAGKGKTRFANVTVNRSAHTISIRSGQSRIEYTFSDREIAVVQEGFDLEGFHDASVKMATAPEGKGGPLDAGQMYADTTAVVLENGLTVRYSMPFHVGGGRVVPTRYLNGSGTNPGDKLQWTFTMGDPADAVQLLSQLNAKAVDTSYGSLLDNGNQGFGINHFPDPKSIRFSTSHLNNGKEPQPLSYRLRIRDSRAGGKIVAELKQDATLTPGVESTLTWQPDALPSDFYYATFAAMKGETILTETKLTFAVDLANYNRPLTRPADFDTFWQRQEQRLKDTPANFTQALISPESADYKAYATTFDAPGGFTSHGVLVIPNKPGKKLVRFGSLIDGPMKEFKDRLAKGDYFPGNCVVFYTLMPDDGTYTRWASAADNNMLDVIFVWLRGIDLVTALPDVDPARVLLHGASRTGGATVTVAALRPNNVCGADGHVHTSCGLSWTDKPYLGWGKTPNASDPADVAAFSAMTAYVDPVNHAPNVRAPIVLGYGIDDVFSPPEGIEAIFHLVKSDWKRISRDEGGHQYSPGFQKIQRELWDKVGYDGVGPDMKRTLKDH